MANLKITVNLLADTDSYVISHAEVRILEAGVAKGLKGLSYNFDPPLSKSIDRIVWATLVISLTSKKGWNIVLTFLENLQQYGLCFTGDPTIMVNKDSFTLAHAKLIVPHELRS